jgi:hypothetical protein
MNNDVNFSEEFGTPMLSEQEGKAPEDFPEESAVEFGDAKTAKFVETLTAVVINLQRDFDTFRGNVAVAFKEIGHADTWRKIAGE